MLMCATATAVAGCSSSPTVIVHNQTGEWFVGIVQIPMISEGWKHPLNYTPSGSVRNELVIGTGAPETFRYGDRGFASVSSYSHDVAVAVRTPADTWWIASVHCQNGSTVELFITRSAEGVYSATTRDATTVEVKEIPRAELNATLGKPHGDYSED